MHSHSEFLRAHVEHILVWHIWHVTKQDDTTHYPKKKTTSTPEIKDKPIYLLWPFM